MSITGTYLTRKLWENLTAWDFNCFFFFLFWVLICINFAVCCEGILKKKAFFWSKSRFIDASTEFLLIKKIEP